MAPRLETPRLALRQFAPSDWDAIGTMLSDPLVVRYMHFVTWTQGQCRQWFDWCVMNAQQPDSDALNWAITRNDSGTVIGLFHSQPSEDNAAAATGERSLGYLLDPTAWNQGYMTEVLRVVLGYEFDTCGTPLLRATCHVANTPSARVMEKVGMRREKTVFDADFAGTSAQWHHYVITKAEYEGRR